MTNDDIALPRQSNGLLAALRFLLPLRREGVMGEGEAGAMSRAATWFVPIGLLIGLTWVGVFRLAWRVFGETANMRVLPAATVTLFECLITGPFFALGLARTIHLLAGLTPRHAAHEASAPLSPVGTLVLALTVLCEWVLIVSIPDVTTWWPSDWDWRHYFNFLYPRAVFRPLILAPLWGRWAVLLAATLGRTTRQADPLTAALGLAMRPSRLLRHAFLPVVLTAIYCSREHNRFIGVVMAMIVFAVTYVVSVVMAHRGGGQTRQSLFAAGQIAQLTCLAVYRGFWPLIHG